MPKKALTRFWRLLGFLASVWTFPHTMVDKLFVYNYAHCEPLNFWNVWGYDDYGIRVYYKVQTLAELS